MNSRKVCIVPLSWKYDLSNDIIEIKIFDYQYTNSTN